MDGRLFVVGCLGDNAPIPSGVDFVAAFPSVLERIPFSGEKVELKLPLDSALSRIGELLERGSVAVVLSGDPLFFGMGERIKRRFPQAEVLPSVSYMQVAFSRMGRSWQDVSFFSAHGRSLEGILRELALSKGGLFVFTDQENTPAAVASFLLDAGVDVKSFWVFERLCFPDERVRCIPPEEAAHTEYLYPNCVFLEVPPREREDVWRDEAFLSERGTLTKGWLRGILSSFFTNGRVFWDLGAGTGAVSISLWRRYERLFAVEMGEGRFGLLLENRRRFGAWNVIPVLARAQDAIRGLPDPDGVFLGVGRSGFTELFFPCYERLRPGGVLAATFVTAEGVAMALETAGKVGARVVEFVRYDYSSGIAKARAPVWVLVVERSS